MPCTAGIKVSAAHVGVPASDAYRMMGWNAMTAKHKELHPKVQQARSARTGLWCSTLCHHFHLLTFLYRCQAHGSPGSFSVRSQSPFRQWKHSDTGNCITAPRFSSNKTVMWISRKFLQENSRKESSTFAFSHFNTSKGVT